MFTERLPKCQAVEDLTVFALAPKANAMMGFRHMPQPQAKPGVANAEAGLVVLDGPSGVAVTMTPDAARKTGESLIAAALAAGRPDR